MNCDGVTMQSARAADGAKARPIIANRSRDATRGKQEREVVDRQHRPTVRSRNGNMWFVAWKTSPGGSAPRLISGLRPSRRSTRARIVAQPE